MNREEEKKKEQEEKEEAKKKNLEGLPPELQEGNLSVLTEG